MADAFAAARPGLVRYLRLEGVGHLDGYRGRSRPLHRRGRRTSCGGWRSGRACCPRRPRTREPSDRPSLQRRPNRYAATAHAVPRPRRHHADPPRGPGGHGAVARRRVRQSRRASTRSSRQAKHALEDGPGAGRSPCSGRPTRSTSSSPAAAPGPTTSAWPDRPWPRNGRGGVVTTAVEHEAVLETARFLERLGCRVCRWSGSTRDGLADPGGDRGGGRDRRRRWCR